MRKLQAQLFTDLAAALGYFDSMGISLRARSGKLKGASEVTEKDHVANQVNILLTVREECQSCGFQLSIKTLDKMLTLIRSSLGKDTDFEELGRLSRELEERLHDEMSTQYIFGISADKARMLDDEFPFGDEVSKNFPSAEFDIREAVTCAAFERWTASVFHSMRVLEIGLSVLAKDLKVKSDYTNWQNIIEGIEKETKNINKDNSGDDWKVKQQFDSEAALQFRYFKNAWRNHVMHIRDNHDEQRAMAIIGHVKEFMAHLATRLKE